MLKLAARIGRKVGTGLLALCTAAATASAAAAPALHWSAIGPHGENIFNLAPATGGAGVLWTAVPGLGLSRSLDGGASWEPPPLPSPRSYSGVVTDPADPLTVYAE